MKPKAFPSLPRRKKDSHKGDYGKVLIVGGCITMPGAAILAAMGSLRAGAGLVTTAVPKSILPPVQAQLREATFLPLAGTSHVSDAAARIVVAFSVKVDATVLGPGLGQTGAVRSFVKEIVQKLDKPLLLDADALNALGKNVSMLARRKAPTVLTPHPGEMGRLLGTSSAAVQNDRKAAAIECAKRSRSIVVLKGSGTIVTDRKRLYLNQTGNPGMASGGMGDVLSGMIGAFLARGLDPFDAAVLGVNRHGRAGDLAAEVLGQDALMASDLLEFLPLAMKELRA